MKTILISEFKAKCIGLLKEVQATKEPLVVTLRGKPIAQIEPFKTEQTSRVVGGLQGTVSINGDIVTCDFTDDWEADGN